jgi:hypothetical protein
MPRWSVIAAMAVLAFTSVLFAFRGIASLETMHHMDPVCFAECIRDAAPDDSVSVAIMTVAVAAAGFVVRVCASRVVPPERLELIPIHRKGILRLQRRD